jgi:hypothetical protein
MIVRPTPFLASLLLLLAITSASADGDFLAVPNVSGAVRGLHVWSGGGILLVLTVDGAWYWHKEERAPAPRPLDLGRVERVEEWNGALYLNAEKGLYWWQAGEAKPEQVKAGRFYRFGHWGNQLLLYGDDGLYICRSQRDASWYGEVFLDLQRVGPKAVVREPQWLVRS